MEILEKLYNSTAKNLSRADKDWLAFGQEFKQIFDSDMILYRITFSDGAVDLFDPISTSDPEIVKKYVEDKMYEYHPMAESDMPSLEPDRRSDAMTDEDFKQLGPYADMMIDLGIFYLIVVPAKLPDDMYVAMVCWRDEASGDFSNLEKQRLALIMRHLLVYVGEQEFVLNEPESDVVSFGKKYSLTETEVSILSALLQGHALKLIAEETKRTYGTVRWHVQNILEKCQVGNQKELLREFYMLIKS